MKIRPVPIIFLISYLIISTVYVLNSQTQVLPILTLYLSYSVAVALIAIYTSRIYGFKSANGRALLLITTGLVFWTVGEVIWYVLKNFMDADPYTSMADVFYLTAYPLLGIGIYQGFVTAGVKLKQIKKSLLTKVILASIILTALVGYFGVYQAYDSSADLLTNIVYIGYGVGDLILVIASMLTILASREYGDGKLASFWKAMATGFFLTLIADILFAIYADQFEMDIKPYTYIDLIWTAGYLTLAYGMLKNYIHVTEVQKKIKLMLKQRNNPIGA